jgi:hypothetical protein
MKYKHKKITGIVIFLFLIALRLIIAKNQMIFITPGSAPIDDDLYFAWANSIVAGNWLGRYNYLTLSKYPLFARWLAFIHIVKIPYIIANCILWIFTAMLAVWTFSPFLKSMWGKILIFAAVLYNPTTWASFNLRVYRDSLFCILCTVFFLCFTGRAVRVNESIKKQIPFLVLAGLALGGGGICREDGLWLLPFAACAVLICIIYIINSQNLRQKAKRVLILFIPGVLIVLSFFTICIINYKYYNRFTISDFSGGEFAACYGAMTRPEHEKWNPLVAVPFDVRKNLYETCPDFAPFEPLLESGNIKKAFYNTELQDYSSGAFYWALRRGAQQLGIYDSYDNSQKYWENLARQVNAAADNTENSLPPRKSVTPPIKKEYILPVVKTAKQSAKYIFSFEDMQPYSKQLSDVTTGKIEIWENFLYTRSNYRAVENTAEPYHTPIQKVVFSLCEKITAVFRFAAILLFPCACLFIIWNFVSFKKLESDKKILNFALLGYIFMAVFRVFIMSFMEVAAFNIGIYSMYLATVYPLVILISASTFFNVPPKIKENLKNAKRKEQKQ